MNRYKLSAKLFISELELNILFITATLDIGGVETYLCRVVPELARDGHCITINVLNNRINKGMLRSVSQHAKVNVLSKFKRLGSFFVYAHPSIDEYDLIYTTGSTSLLCAALASVNTGEAKIVAGVFSQLEYFSKLTLYRNAIAAKLFNRLGANNIVYCTDGCREDHARYFGENQLEAKVSPLFLSVPTEFSPPSFDSNTVKILSIGRLVAFKCYNLYIPKLIQTLRRSGINATWTVVGDGPLRNQMVDFVKNLQLTDFVRFVGFVEYSALSNYYRQCDLYIGAGTTLIEAASFGLPSLCTIDGDNEALTTGFLCDRIGYVTSDKVSTDVISPMIEKIVYFSQLSIDERQALAYKNYNSALRYSSSRIAVEYEDIAAAATITNTANFKLRWYLDIVSILWNFFKGRLRSIDTHAFLIARK